MEDPLRASSPHRRLWAASGERPYTPFGPGKSSEATKDGSPAGISRRQLVAFQIIGDVHLGRDARRLLVLLAPRGPESRFAALPEAEGEAVAAHVGVALEVAEQAAGGEGFAVGEVVEPAEQVEVGAGEAFGEKDD